MALKHEFDAEVGHAMSHNVGRTPRDNRDTNALLLQHAHAVPIARVEGLVLLAAVPKEQTAICKNAIDIEYNEFDLLGLIE